MKRLLQNHYRIGSVAITLQSHDHQLLHIVGRWMDYYKTAPSSQHTSHVQMTLVNCKDEQRNKFRLPTGAQLQFENEHAKYYTTDTLWIAVMHTSSSIVIVNRSNDKAVGLVRPGDLEGALRVDIFMHPLVELLRKHRVYAFHAASVSYNGQGLLMLGKSGQGKTTLSVDLLSHGFDFLADDRCFLAAHEDPSEIWGYYEPIRYYAGNIEHIEAIGQAGARQKLPKLSNGKEQFDLSEIYQNRIIQSSPLCVLIFPHYSPDEATSRLEPVSASEALLTLLPLTMVCFDADTSKAHFQICSEITSTVPSARLIMGQDREQWHRLVKQYLQDVAAKELNKNSVSS